MRPLAPPTGGGDGVGVGGGGGCQIRRLESFNTGYSKEQRQSKSFISAVQFLILLVGSRWSRPQDDWWVVLVNWPSVNSL